MPHNHLLIPVFLHRSAYVSAEFPAEFVDVMVQNGIKLQHLGNAVIRHAVTEYLAGVKRGSSMGTLNEKRIAMHNRNTLSEWVLWHPYKSLRWGSAKAENTVYSPCQRQKIIAEDNKVQWSSILGPLQISMVMLLTEALWHMKIHLKIFKQEQFLPFSYFVCSII